VSSLGFRTFSNFTLGFTLYDQLVYDAFNSNLNASSGTVSAVANLGPYSVAINGRVFTVDTSFEPYRREAFRHKTIPAQRQSINLTNIAGEGTVNTEGLWRREQADWNMGAGQLYLDRKGDAQENRYYQSKGIDPFTTPYQISLTNDVQQIYSTSNANVLTTFANGYFYVADNSSGSTAFKFTNTIPSSGLATWSSVTLPSGVTAINSIATNQNYIWLATNNGVYYSVIGVTSAPTLYRANDTTSGYTGGYDIVRVCNDQIIASRNNRLYSFIASNAVGSSPNAGPTGSQSGGSYVGEILMQHPNPNFIWSDAVGGMSAFYVCGYVSLNGARYTATNRGPFYGGAVYRSSINTSQSASSLTQPWVPNYPISCLPMPMDEVPVSLNANLNYIFVGTNKGIRMCQTLSQYDPTINGGTGDLKAGPYIPNILQPVTQPVSAIASDGRFVWFAWNNYDTTSVGLGKLDITTFIAGDPLAPAYSSDLMVSGLTSPASNQITSASVFVRNVNGQNVGLPVFAVAGKGIYVQDPNHYVASGVIESGIFTYGIPDRKIPIFFDYNCIVPTGASVQASIGVDPNDPDYQGVISLPAVYSSDQSEVPIPQGYSAENFQTSLELNATPDRTGAPSVYRWTVKAWPAVANETQISVVVQLFSVNMVDGMEVYVDPYETITWLDQLRRAQTIVEYQEGPLTTKAIIDVVDWLPHKLRGFYENGFEGDCVIYLKTIGGYVYNPPTTT
jgi:hypothetical protein